MIIRREDVVKEAKRQLWLAVRLSSVGILQYSMQTVSLTFVGHLGTLPLSGASMATSFASVTGFILLLGLASALDTFCGQSNGAGQYHMLGIHMQRSMLVVSVSSVFIAIIWANTEHILIAMHQDKAISKEAGKYARCMIPGLFAYGLFQCILKFLQTQSIVFPMLITTGVAALLDIFLCWVLVLKSRLGSRVAALSNSISYWTRFTTILMQLILLLTLNSLKIWAFELTVLLSGLLPNPALETAVLSICLNTFNLVWMISFGFNAAISTRVSNELGAGNPEGARLAVRVLLSMAVIEGIFLVSIMILLRNIWSHVYSNDKQVIGYVSATMPILAIACFLDGFQSELSGIVAGCGGQKIGAYVNLGSFYLVGVPCSVVLAFVVHMKAKGLWLGIISAFTVQVIFYMIIPIRTNWTEEARKAQSRVEGSNMSPTVTPMTEC